MTTVRALPAPTVGSPRDLFDPSKNPFPRVFPLPEHLNPLWNHDVDIFPVPVYWHNMPNMKAFVARSMLEEAFLNRDLNDVHTLVEATSGNTGLALGILAPYYGIKRVVAVVERDTAPGKLEQLRIAGVDIAYPEGEMTTISTARKMGNQDGWFNLNQYRNPANVSAHRFSTAKHVWQATNERVSFVAAALGTTGTIIGLNSYFRAMDKQVVTVGGMCAPGNAVPGVRTLEKLKEIAFPWKEAVSEQVEVTAREAYRLSLGLCRAGVMAGPSSGLALAALISVLEKVGRDRAFKPYRQNGRVTAAFICGDSMHPYMEKYSMILGPDDFKPLKF